jgi:imidazolonepropionase
MVVRRKLAQRIEVSPESQEAFRESVWSAAGALRMPINLIWPGGPAETLRSFIARAQPRSISCSHALSAAEWTVLAQIPAPVVVTPTRCLTDGRVGSAIVELAEKGTPLAIASGYDENDMPVLSMQAAISLAVLNLGLTTEQAISAATINAAWAAGLAHTTGTLEVGKRADMLVLNLPDYRELPRRFGTNHVGMAIRDGKIAFNRTSWKVSAA